MWVMRGEVVDLLPDLILILPRFIPTRRFHEFSNRISSNRQPPESLARVTWKQVIIAPVRLLDARCVA